MPNADESRLVFDTLVKDFPAHYSEQARDFRRHAVGFAATVRGGQGMLWIGPAGLEFAQTPSSDGRQLKWDEVVDVDVLGSGASQPSVGSIFLLGAWSLLLDPKAPPVDVQVTLTDGTVVGATVLGSSGDDLRALVSGFRAAHVVTTSVQETHGIGALERLSAMHDAGKLTGDEFAAAKRELLGL